MKLLKQGAQFNCSRHIPLKKIVYFFFFFLLISCLLYNLIRLRRVLIGADEFGYISYARNIAQYNSFIIHYPPIDKILKKANIQKTIHDPGISATIYSNGQIMSKYPLGFPLFLALIIKLFGINAVFYITPIFLIILVIIFFFTIKNSLPLNFQLLGAIIAAVSLLGGYKYLFQYSLTPLKEIPALTFMFASLYFIIKFLENNKIQNTWKFILIGFFMGFACLTRSSLFIVALICFTAILIRLGQYGIKQLIIVVLISLFSFFVPFSLQLIQPDWSYSRMMKTNQLLPTWSFIPIILFLMFLLWFLSHLRIRNNKIKKITDPWIKGSLIVVVESIFIIVVACYIIGILKPAFTKGTIIPLPRRFIKNAFVLTEHNGIIQLLLIAVGFGWAVFKNRWSIVLLVFTGSVYFVLVSYFNNYCSPRYLLPVYVLWIPGIACGIIALHQIIEHSKNYSLNIFILFIIIFLFSLEFLINKNSRIIWPRFMFMAIIVLMGGWSIRKKWPGLSILIEWLGITLMVIGACTVMTKVGESKGLFRMKNAVELRHDLAKVLQHENTVILAYRYLCQNLDIHTPYYSFSPDGLRRVSIKTEELCSRLMDEGYTVVIIDNRGVKYDCRNVVNRLFKTFDLTPIISINAAKYNAIRRHLFGRDYCTLYKISRKK